MYLALRAAAYTDRSEEITMYLSIGGDMAVRDRSVIGIFDLDGCSMSKKTMEYLENAEQNGVLLNVTEEMRKKVSISIWIFSLRRKL